MREVMLHPAAQSAFRRVVRARDGSPSHVLDFQPGRPLRLQRDQDLQAIGRDIGAALVIVQREKAGDGSDRIRVDWKETEAVARELRRGKALSAHLDEPRAKKKAPVKKKVTTESAPDRSKVETA